MKRILLFVTALMIIGGSSFAQDAATTNKGMSQYMSLGPIIGFGHNWVSNMGGTSRFMPSGNMGVGFVYARHEHWGWGGQLGFYSEGYDVDYGTHNANIMALYMRMPLRGYYFFGNYKNAVRPKLYLGPTIGLKLAEQDNSDPWYTDVVMAQRAGGFRTVDLGINAGAGVNVQLTKATWLNMDLGYYQGVVDVIKDPAGRNNMNQNIGVNMGILFGIK